MIESSRSGIVHVLALTTCLLSIGCPRTTEPVTAPASVASNPVVAPPESEPTPPPEPARPFEITYLIDQQLWQVDPDATNAHALDYEVPNDGHVGGSRVGDGTHEPTISRDGKWLACLTGTNVIVVELTAPNSPRVHALTSLPPAKDDWLIAAYVSFSEWSPDSSTLLVAIEEPQYEDDVGLPLPSGYQYGFHIVRTTDLRLEHAPHIESYLGWLPDSTAVLDSKYVEQRDYQLVAYPIAPGPAKVLQHSNDGYGYSQVSVMGARMAWTAHGADSRSSQIQVVPITGGEALPLSPIGTFAEIQWPMLSPSGKRAVFAQNGKLMLGEGDGAPTKWPSHAEFQWWDDEHVVTVTEAGLVMMDLQGQARVLDAAGTQLVHH